MSTRSAQTSRSSFSHISVLHFTLPTSFFTILLTDTGLIEIISPPGEFYPDMASLKQTLGDDMERVTWRSKQALDFSFLMMYAKDRGTFYVQLEDDVLTNKVGN